jgi:hypothetical protein
MGLLRMRELLFALNTYPLTLSDIRLKGGGVNLTLRGHELCQTSHELEFLCQTSHLWITAVTSVTLTRVIHTLWTVIPLCVGLSPIWSLCVVTVTIVTSTIAPYMPICAPYPPFRTYHANPPVDYVF